MERWRLHEGNQERLCSKCHQWQTMEHFLWNKSKNGYQGWCRTCTKKYAKRQREKAAADKATQEGGWCMAARWAKRIIAKDATWVSDYNSS